MKFKILFLIVIFTLFSCKKTIEYEIEKNGISFVCPENWSIIEEEQNQDGSFYLSIEKNGFDTSGLITLTSVEELYDLDEYIELYIEELKNSFTHKKATFNSIENVNFNLISSRSSKFNFSIIGIKHEGELYAFHDERRTYLIIKQEAIEDKKENANAFKRFEESFLIK